MKTKDLIVQRKLKARRIYIWDDIIEDTAGHFLEQMDLLLSRSTDPVWILIHSGGGSVSAATAIIDEIQAVQNRGVTVSTCALGMACSAAALILAMGTPGCRYVRPGSVVMMHPVSFGLSADYAEMQERVTAFYKKDSERINRQLAEACGRGGKKYRGFLRDIEKGLWLNAEAAVKYGVADHIWTRPLPLTESGHETNDNERGIRRGVSEFQQPESPALGDEEIRQGPA